MKALLRILVLITVFAGLMPSLQSQGVPRKLLFRTSGGLPGSTRFRVELDDEGVLKVVKESMPLTEEGKLTKVTIKKQLTPEERDLLFSLAENANDFSEKPPGSFADGTNANLHLIYGPHPTTRECFNASHWPIGEQTKAFLAEINRHFSKRMRVY
jgi:hypothetical protein